MGLFRVLMIVPLLLCACGGGGGGGGGGNSNADQQAAKQLLMDCGFDGIEGFLDVLGIAVAIVEPGGPTLASIQVMAAEQMLGHIAWTADLGGDPAPELLGDVQFLDDMGQAAEPPFDITQFIAAGLGGLDAFLPQLPDGWTVAITINSVAPPLGIANFFFSYTSGAMNASNGNATVQNPPCGSSFTYSGATFADLGGPFPDMTFMSSYTSGGTSIDGTTTLDGTDVVTVDGTVNGGTTTYAFDVDLGAQTVTPVP